MFSHLRAESRWIEVNSNQPQPIKLNIVQKTANSITIEYKIPGFFVDNVSINHQEYAQIYIPNLRNMDNKGYPSLPKLFKNVFFNFTQDQFNFTILNIETKTIPLKPIVPSKGSISMKEDPKNVPFVFADYYDNGKSYPHNHLTLSPSFKLRKKHGITVKFYPIIYNRVDKTASVVSKLTVKIDNYLSQPSGRTPNHTLGPYLPSIVPISNNTGSYSFPRNENDCTLPATLVTPATPEHTSNSFFDEHSILVISHDDFLSVLQPFIQWKRQLGFKVFLSAISQIGNNQRNIKQHIKKLYDTHNIAYVILVGDHNLVASHRGTAGNVRGEEADPLYTLVEGDDNYPDLYLSRISVNTIEELEIVLAKSIQYEKKPDRSGNWYQKALLIASDQTGVSGGVTLSDHELAQHLKKKLLATSSYQEVHTVLDPGATKEQVFDILKSGVGFVSYSGHGLENNWTTTGLSSYDIQDLENLGKLPFVISVGCYNGDFGYSFGDSLAESWLKAGTRNQPIGAIAVFASSTEQSWITPTVGQETVFEEIAQETNHTIGSIFTSGSIAILEDDSNTAEQTFQSWHIFGDSTLKIRTRKPTSISHNAYDQSITKRGIALSTEKDVMITLVQQGRLLSRLIVPPKINDNNVNEETNQPQSQDKLKTKLINVFLSIPNNPNSLNEDFLNTNDPIWLTLSGFNRIPEIIEFRWDVNRNVFVPHLLTNPHPSENSLTLSGAPND